MIDGKLACRISSVDEDTPPGDFERDVNAPATFLVEPGFELVLGGSVVARILRHAEDRLTNSCRGLIHPEVLVDGLDPNE